VIDSLYETQRFRLRAERLNGFVRLRASGELDLSTARFLDEPLARLQQERATVIVDLSGVDFVGVSGLRVFLDASRRARSTGGSVVIVNCARPARRVFEVTSTLDLLDAPAVAELFDDDREWSPMQLVGAGSSGPSAMDGR
jgi:anti-anti-sigma factor